MNYREALIEALLNKELVQNYDRLSKSHLGSVLKGINQGGLNHMIDVSTGALKSELLKFDAFFYEFVWNQLPEECFTDNQPNQ